MSSGSTPSSASVDVPVPSGLAVSSAHKGSVSEDPPPTIAVEGGTEKEGEGRLQYQSIKRLVQMIASWFFRLQILCKI